MRYNDRMIINVARLKEAALWIDSNETVTQYVGDMAITISRTENDIIIMTLCNSTLGIRRALLRDNVFSMFTQEFSKAHKMLLEADEVPVGIGG